MTAFGQRSIPTWRCSLLCLVSAGGLGAGVGTHRSLRERERFALAVNEKWPYTLANTVQTGASGHTGNMDFLSASKKGCFTLAFRSFGLKALLSGLRAGIPCYVALFDLFVLSRNSPELCATRCLGAKSVLGIFLRSMGVRCCESILARIF